jgi:uncharacterized Fe-S center protein
MKRVITLLAMAALIVGCGSELRKKSSEQEGQNKGAQKSECCKACSEKEASDEGVEQSAELPKVFMTTDISPEGLKRVYEALGVAAHGNVAVKISTGEPGGKNYLKPELIGLLVQSVDGTIVECNTAYKGRRFSSEEHLKAAREHGFFEIADVDIMDSEGEIKIPVQDTKHLKYNLVGKNIENYDFMINLAHFKGHAMGGFGGVLKNQSIGVASRNGKAYIHSVGITENPDEMWGHIDDQIGFLESMAAAAQSYSASASGANSMAGSRLATLIFAMPSRFRPSARIIREPAQVISAMAASVRTGAITCAIRTSAP